MVFGLAIVIRWMNSSQLPAFTNLTYTAYWSWIVLYANWLDYFKSSTLNAELVSSLGHNALAVDILHSICRDTLRKWPILSLEWQQIVELSNETEVECIVWETMIQWLCLLFRCWSADLAWFGLKCRKCTTESYKSEKFCNYFTLHRFAPKIFRIMWNRQSTHDQYAPKLNLQLSHKYELGYCDSCVRWGCGLILKNAKVLDLVKSVMWQWGWVSSGAQDRPTSPSVLRWMTHGLMTGLNASLEALTVIRRKNGLTFVLRP